MESMMSGVRSAAAARPLVERGGNIRTLGIDPGLNTTGYAVVENRGGRIELVEAGVIRGRQRGSLPGRLKEIYDGVCDVIATLTPQALAIEELYSHYERPRTAILMGHARGAICLAAANSGMTIHSYAATQVKRLLTGSGRAPKNQIQNAICREFGLSSPPEPPDVADAIAIAICHIYMSRKLTCP
jgi:crossover junction endodeoxyribonuclease RuvC